MADGNTPIYHEVLGELYGSGSGSKSGEATSDEMDSSAPSAATEDPSKVAADADPTAQSDD